MKPNRVKMYMKVRSTYPGEEFEGHVIHMTQGWIVIRKGRPVSSNHAEAKSLKFDPNIVFFLDPNCVLVRTETSLISAHVQYLEKIA